MIFLSFLILIGAMSMVTLTSQVQGRKTNINQSARGLSIGRASFTATFFTHDGREIASYLVNCPIGHGLPLGHEQTLANPEHGYTVLARSPSPTPSKNEPNHTEGNDLDRSFPRVF